MISTCERSFVPSVSVPFPANGIASPIFTSYQKFTRSTIKKIVQKSLTSLTSSSNLSRVANSRFAPPTRTLLRRCSWKQLHISSFRRSSLPIFYVVRQDIRGSRTDLPRGSRKIAHFGTRDSRLKFFSLIPSSRPPPNRRPWRHLRRPKGDLKVHNFRAENSGGNQASEGSRKISELTFDSTFAGARKARSFFSASRR